MTWRVGRKLGRTLYDDQERLVGMMDTPELAELVVAAMDHLNAAKTCRCSFCGLDRDHTEVAIESQLCICKECVALCAEAISMKDGTWRAK